MSPNLRLRARWITPAARAWLRRGAPARVLHIFDRACNLADAQGEILSLVSTEAAAGPFSLLVPGPGGKTPDWGGFQAWVDIDSKVSGAPALLHVGDLEIDVSGADEWLPRPDWAALRAGRAIWEPRLPHIREKLRASAPAGSLADLPTHTPEATGADAIYRQLLLNADKPAQDVSSGIGSRDVSTIQRAARALAGLGSGLTPAGDDFLVGAMHAAWAAYPDREAAALCEAVAGAAAPRTSLLSAAWLKAAARGDCGWPWQRLLQALADPDAPGLDEAVVRLASIGHTSGADALTGFLMALEAIGERGRWTMDDGP